MQKLEIYCNYGVLAAEKINVYTYGAEHVHAACSDCVTVIVPDEWELYKNVIGEVMVQAPWGECYQINDVLQGDAQPCFCAIDNEMQERRVYLEEVVE